MNGTMPILCDIGEHIELNSAGVRRRCELSELLSPGVMERVYQVQFSEAPSDALLSKIVERFRNRPDVGFRMYGTYVLEDFNVEILDGVRGLTIELRNVKSVSLLSRLRKLISLSLGTGEKRISLEPICELRELRFLSTSIGKDIERISELNNLRSLCLRDVDARGAQSIASLDGLKTLWLIGTKGGLGWLEGLRSIESLYLYSIGGGDEGVVQRVLSSLSNLKTLKIEKQKIVHSLDFIYEMKRLAVLVIMGLKLEALRPIEFASSLESFAALDCTIEDKDLSSLLDVQNVDLYLKGVGKGSISEFVKTSRSRNVTIAGSLVKGKDGFIDPFGTWRDHVAREKGALL